MKIPYKYRLIGWNYVLINLPFLVVGKVGFSSTFKGVWKRSESTSDAAPGILWPIMAIPLPFAWFIEQAMLKLLSPTRSRYYKGDGHTEAVNIGGVLAAWLIYACVWLAYLELAYMYDLSPVGAMWMMNKFAIVAKIFVGKLAFLV